MNWTDASKELKTIIKKNSGEFDKLMENVTEKQVIIRNKFISIFKKRYQELIKKVKNNIVIMEVLLKELETIKSDISKLNLKDDDNKRRVYEIHKDVIMHFIEDIINDTTKIDYDNTKNKYYPSLDNSEFNRLIYNKKEFKKTEYTKKKKNKDEPFTLSHSQTFVKNYISEYTPYNGILIWPKLCW